MNEYEINKAVAEKLGLPHEVTRYGVVTRESNKEQWCEFDPCNNAQQAWAIMLANNISVTKDGDGGFMAFIPNCFFDGTMEYTKEDVSYSEKPFVAAMLLFLEI